MSDIIERLRAAVPTYEDTPIAWPCKVRSELLLEAAAEVERLRGDARAITAIAHTGGTYGLSEREALVEIRRRTLKAWDRTASRARMRDSAFVPLAEVERLTRERDEARAEVERLHKAHEAACRGGEWLLAEKVSLRARMCGEISDLRAENARLRAKIAEYFAEPDTHPVEEP